MTALHPGSKIHREISISGVDKPVQVEIAHNGLSFWCKGSRKKVWVPWPRVVDAGQTPEDVPSFLMGKPLELLRHQAARAS